MHFFDLEVRQNHPGPRVQPYQDMRAKLNDVRRYQQDEGIPWTVAADDLEGTAHQVYGGMSDPTYLIDKNGRVAFYNMWTHVPTLSQAIEALMEQGGAGVVRGGVDKFMHLAPAMTAGWPAIRRGLPQSCTDLELAAPGSGASLWLAYQMRWALAPLTLRERPLPPAAKIGLGVVAAGVAVWAARRAFTTEARRHGEGQRRRAAAYYADERG